MSFQQPTRALVSQADSAIIARPDVPRSRFHNRWGKITAFDAGKLVPFMIEEIYPGDHVVYNIQPYVRLQTLLFPNFSQQRVDVHVFFCPWRLVWSNWEEFMGQQATPASSIAFTIPVLASPNGGSPVGSIYDHMELPVAGQVTPGESFDFSVLYFRAYNLIYNEWYRDQNSQNSVPQLTGNSGDALSDYTLLTRNKSHDYLTSLLPWPQKFTAPTLPLGGLAPVIGIGVDPNTAAATPVDVYETNSPVGIPTTYNFYKEAWVDNMSAQGGVYVKMAAGAGNPQVFADLAAATGITINTLREAWLIQMLLERDARGGTRYIEKVWSHFGVRNPDFRLQRPEYIGGGSFPLNVTAVAQTAPTDNAPLAALGATGTGAGNARASYAATEHGCIIGIISVRSELHYQQGLPKKYSRRTQYDHYFPVTAHLGEQAVLRKEVFCTGVDADDNSVMGYQERWQELRTNLSWVTGNMRSTAAVTLDAWHLGQYFASAPALSGTFLEDRPPMERVLAAGEEAEGQQYLADINMNRLITRAMPMFGTPASIGRL